MREVKFSYKEYEEWNHSNLSSEKAISYLKTFNENEPTYKQVLEKEFELEVENPVSLLNENESARIFNEIKEKIRLQQEKDAVISSLHIVKNFNTGIVWRIAAILIFVVAGAITIRFINNNNYKIEKNVVAIKPLQSERNIIHNPKKSYKKILLPDSSIVMLGSNSSISYSNVFSTIDRNIELTGKGWFKVKKNAKPFKVYASGTITIAIGTEFYIDADDNDNIKIKLKEGKVSVELMNSKKGIQKLLLNPGEEVLINVSKEFFKPIEKIKKLPVAIPDITKIKEDSIENDEFGDTEFVKMPLGEILKGLSVKYTVTFRMKNIVNENILVTGSFMQTGVLADALGMLEQILPIKFTIEGDTVYVSEQ